VTASHDHDHGHEAADAVHSPDAGHLHAEVREPGFEKTRRLRWAIIVTGGVMLLEVVGGLLSNSLALLSDAGHMFTHIFALGMSYFAIVISARPASRERSFGHFRAEVLAAFINGIVLFGITGHIFYEAISRLIRPEQVEMAEMLLIAVIGLVANGVSVFLLAGVSSGDLNLKSAFIHVVYDTASSVAVVAAAIAIHLTGMTYFDPTVSLLIGVLILFWAARIVSDSVHILMESTPPDVDLDAVRDDIVRVPGVQGAHDIHVWQITTNIYVMTAHVVVENVSIEEGEAILDEINHHLREHHKIGHSTLQLECTVSPGLERESSPREWPGGSQ